jgi:uncharacterized protein with PhoU and TrkA domain
MSIPTPSLSPWQHVYHVAKTSHQNLTQAAIDLAQLIPHGLEAREVVRLAKLCEALMALRYRPATDSAQARLMEMDLRDGMNQVQEIVAVAFSTQAHRLSRYTFPSQEERPFLRRVQP